MPSSDQFAPGFEGLVIGIIVIVALLIVFAMFHTPIIHFSIHLYYRMKDRLSDMGADIHNAQESEKDQSGENI